jgi:hypothetical protein
MLGRRIGRGGLLRAALATAVVSGTATAVSGRVQGRQAVRFQQESDAEAYRQQQEAQSGRQPAHGKQPAAAPPAQEDDLVSRLQTLAGLYSQGMLSEQEFTAAKAKLLA